MKFGILSTIDNLLLPFFIEELLNKGIKDINIILDSKQISKKDSLIFKKRTNGKFGDYSQIVNRLFFLKRVDVPFYFVDNHNSNKSIDLYQKLGLQCLLNAGTPRKISKVLIDNMKRGIVNIHPGIIPQYRGCSCVEWAIYNDEQIGNTAHFMNINYDTGPIIEIEKYIFNPKNNYCDIRNHVYVMGYKLATRVLKKIQENELILEKATPQETLTGKTWTPIPYDLEEIAIQKANEGKYKFQEKF